MTANETGNSREYAYRLSEAILGLTKKVVDLGVYSFEIDQLVITFTIIAWNNGDNYKDHGEGFLVKFLEELKQIPEMNEEIEMQFRRAYYDILSLRREMFPNDHRIITNYEYNKLPDNQTQLIVESEDSTAPGVGE